MAGFRTSLICLSWLFGRQLRLRIYVYHIDFRGELSQKKISKKGTLQRPEAPNIALDNEQPIIRSLVKLVRSTQNCQF